MGTREPSWGEPPQEGTLRPVFLSATAFPVGRPTGAKVCVTPHAFTRTSASWPVRAMVAANLDAVGYGSGRAERGLEGSIGAGQDGARGLGLRCRQGVPQERRRGRSKGSSPDRPLHGSRAAKGSGRGCPTPAAAAPPRWVGPSPRWKLASMAARPSSFQPATVSGRTPIRRATWSTVALPWSTSRMALCRSVALRRPRCPPSFSGLSSAWSRFLLGLEAEDPTRGLPQSLSRVRRSVGVAATWSWFLFGGVGGGRPHSGSSANARRASTSGEVLGLQGNLRLHGLGSFGGVFGVRSAELPRNPQEQIMPSF
jgi:hypothetical protein